MSKLKPCPYCGSDYMNIMNMDGFLWVHCGKCDAESAPMKSKERAIDKWNNRPHENKIKADAVREAAKLCHHPTSSGRMCPVEQLEDYADKIERDEL